MSKPSILLIGPNCVGKSTFFHSLINARHIETHYFPGTKTKIHIGQLRIGSIDYEVIDTPGINNLVPTAENELITLRLILEKQPEKIIFITHEEYMEQSIQLLVQIAELDIPFLIVFYQKNDFVPVTIKYDYIKLGRIFNAGVVHAAPILSKGITEVKKQLQHIFNTRWVGNYTPEVEKLILELEDELRGKTNLEKAMSLRALAVMLILKNDVIIDWLRKNTTQETWLRIVSILNNKIKKNYSFAVAAHWKNLAHSLLAEITIVDNVYKPRYLALLNKYSLLPFWDFMLIFITFYLWYKILFVIGSKYLVNLFYNELFGKYLQPFFEYMFGLLLGKNILTDLLVGPYGLFNIGIMYTFAVILPIVFVFFLIYAFLEEAGYLTHMALSLNRFFSLLGINSYAFPHLIVGNSCKILSLIKTRILETKKEKLLVLLILILGIPCISQISIIINLLSIIPWQYRFIYFGLIIGQLFLVTKLFSLWNKNMVGSTLVVKVTPLKLPNLLSVLKKAFYYGLWFIKEITPLMLFSAFLLFCFNLTGLLSRFSLVMAPVLQYLLNLPTEFSEAILLGLFRKDLGAVYLYDLANNGFLNSIQVLVSITFLTLFVPCLSFILMLYKEKGARFMAAVLALSGTYALLVAFILNKILRI